MEVEKVETSSENDKKGYNPDEIKTIVDVLDQRALMNIITNELPSYTGSKMLKLSKLGINKMEALSCLDHLNRLDLSYNKLKSVRVSIKYILFSVGFRKSHRVNLFEFII